jgi:transcriptional regulator EpsA
MNKHGPDPEAAGNAHGYPGPERRNRQGRRRQADLVPLLAALGQTRTRDDFIAWSRHDLAHHLPHGAFICCLGKVEAHGAKPIETLSAKFPADFARAEIGAPGNFRACIMRQWLHSGEPILANPEDLGRVIDDPAGLRNFAACKLQNIAAHGMLDFTRVYVSHFSFHRIPARLNERHRQFLELLVPPMHAALLRVVRAVMPDAVPSTEAEGPLTPRELEILGWVSAGKTNDEISTILGTSYKTVKNQVQSILVKLRVNNRAQAVATAARLGLPLGGGAMRPVRDRLQP